MNMAKISAVVNDHPTVPGRKIRQYLLTKMQTMDLMTGYNTELRIKVNRRWKAPENNVLKTILLPSRKGLTQMVIGQLAKIEAMSSLVIIKPHKWITL